MLTSIKSITKPRRLIQWSLLAVLVSVVAYLAGEKYADAELQRQIALIRQSIRVQTLGFREAAARYVSIPYAVSKQQDILAVLASPEDPLLVEKANRYLKDFNKETQSLALYVMNAEGLTLAASNSGEPSSFIGSRFGERPYFDQAIKGELGRFYGVGLKTGEPGLFIAMPVRAEDGSVVGVAAVKVGLNAIESSWSAVRSTSPILLSDRHGIVFLSNVDAWRYRATIWSDKDYEKTAYVKQYGDRVTFPPVPWTSWGVRSDPGTSVVKIDGTGKSLIVVDEKMSELNKALPGMDWTLTVTGDYGLVEKARYQGIFIALLASSSLFMALLYWRREQEVRTELKRQVDERTRDLQGQTNFRKSMEDSLVIGMRARLLDGTMQYVNDAMCDMVGYGKHELEGRMPPYPYWHPDDLERHWRDNDAILAGEAPSVGIESRIRHRDGRDVYTRIYTAKWMNADDQHIGWMSSVVDITEQRRAQRRHEAEMQQAGLLANLGVMASTVAHELNQPLAALSNYAIVAKGYAQQGNQALLQGCLDDVSAQALRAGEIVSRIRLFVTKRKRTDEDCVINQIVGNALDQLKDDVRHCQASVQKQLAADLPTLRGDPVLLERVVTNLVNNALQAMSEMALEQRIVEIETARVDGGIRLNVSDRGQGIDADVAVNLFKLFYTTKANGHGLGLNLCRTIVENHGGRLSFTNRPEGGACFTVFLEVRS